MLEKAYKFKVKLTKDIDLWMNDKTYFKNKILNVTELDFSPNYYAYYYVVENGFNCLDYIPKDAVIILEKY